MVTIGTSTLCLCGFRCACASSCVWQILSRLYHTAITPRYKLIPLSATMSLRGTLSRCQHSTSGSSPRHWPLPFPCKMHLQLDGSCNMLTELQVNDTSGKTMALLFTKAHLQSQTNVSCVPQWARCSFTADKTLLLPVIWQSYLCTSGIK
jgi:hypothetical protein